MGQQQLLLVILVTILVGIATVVAINVFGDAAEQGNRDAVRQDLLQGAASAQALWTKPELLGGAGRDFSTITEDDVLLRALGIPGAVSGGELTNENGVYTIGNQDELVLQILATPTSYQHDINITITRLAEPDADGNIWQFVVVDEGDN